MILSMMHACDPCVDHARPIPCPTLFCVVATHARRAAGDPGAARHYSPRNSKTLSAAKGEVEWESKCSAVRKSCLPCGTSYRTRDSRQISARSSFRADLVRFGTRALRLGAGNPVRRKHTTRHLSRFAHRSSCGANHRPGRCDNQPLACSFETNSALPWTRACNARTRCSTAFTWRCI